MTSDVPLLINDLGEGIAYQEVWDFMRAYTDARDIHSPDQLLILEHAPVYTLGQAGKMEHVLAPGEIPLVQSDRGGQVTYHGPGQIVMYLLVDIRRRRLGVRSLVTLIEESIIELVAGFGATAYAKPDAPGVYVEGAKIGSVGLRIRKGCSYHGLSLNVDMDLAPFSRINPCGYQGLAMTQIKDLVVGSETNIASVKAALANILMRRLQLVSGIISSDSDVEREAAATVSI